MMSSFIETRFLKLVSLNVSDNLGTPNHPIAQRSRNAAEMKPSLSYGRKSNGVLLSGLSCNWCLIRNGVGIQVC